MALSKDAAILGGYGCTTFTPLKKVDAIEPVGDNPGTPAKIEPNEAIADWFHTGKLYENKVVQTTSSLDVAEDGKVTGSLETTNYGPESDKFVQDYVPIYQPNWRQQANASDVETITDETGWKSQTEAAAPNVELDKMLLAIFWGGNYTNSKEEVTVNGVKEYHYTIRVDVALVSLGNQIASTTRTANTWMRRNFQLNGHIPDDNIEISIGDLNDKFKNKIGLEVLGVQHDKYQDKIVLEKDTPIISYNLTVKYNQNATLGYC